MTSRHTLVTVDALTHASRVIPVVRCNEAVSLIFTVAFVPLNESALPYLPAVVQVALTTVPVFPLPEASATVLPVPSVKAYAATSAGAVRSSRVSTFNFVVRGRGRR